MEYYILHQFINKDGSEPSQEKLNKFTGRYYAKFRSVWDEVYWNVITSLMEMKNGHPIKTLDVECCRVRGELTEFTSTITVTTLNHIYIFEKVNVNPLDKILKD